MESGELGYVFYPIDYTQAPPGEKLLDCVRKKNVKEATSFLVNGTKPNFQDPQTGDTALHIAVEVRSEVLVKLLIVFDANLTLKNTDNQTALDIANKEGATDIAKIIKDILELQNDLDKDEPRSQVEKHSSIEDSLLLSLDGGGIRGLIFVQVLLEMEKRRKKLYPHDKDTLLSKFNWITGTSAGGIGALAFAAARKNVEQTRRLFFEMKDEVLRDDPEPPIPNERVDKVFQKVYGKSATMSDIKGPNVSVMTTLANQSPPILHIMSNYGPARNGQDPPDKQLVWKAARSTSAVPIFFHPQDGKYLDGGLIAGNPTSDAIVDMFEEKKKQQKQLNLKVVLSLGCGLMKPQPVDDIDFEPSQIGDAIAHIIEKLGMHKLGEHAQELFLVLHNFKAFLQLHQIEHAQIIQHNGEVLKRSQVVSEIVGAQFFRINPPIDNVYWLTTDDTILVNMLYQVVHYMLKNCRQITDPVLESIYGF